MKLRTDYVTNSSTTSYLIICEEDFSREDLAQLMGVMEGSPLMGLVDALYDAFHHNMEPVRLASEIDKKYDGALEAYLRGDYSERVLRKVKQADKQGKRVYVGSLASDNTMIESLFCCDSFEWENDKLYVNALECAW